MARPSNRSPPGSAVSFELLSDRAGAVVYRSQTLEQMRELSRPDAARPAFRQVLTIPGCAMPDDATRCLLDTFARLGAEQARTREVSRFLLA